MIRIVKASAGSGKTYRLALEYIRLLLSSRERYAYRSILAVTFTNKATDEMKRRILKELYQLSVDPAGSHYYKEFVPSLFPGPEGLKERASAHLYAILHDYTAFAVSTIDSFFQQTLRAFSREIGQFASYQVNLDRDGLIAESVDRVLDALTESDENLLKWLTDSAMEELGSGRKFRLESALTEVAKTLRSEVFQEKVEACGFDVDAVFSRGHLRTVRDACNAIVAAFPQRLEEAAAAILDLLEREGIDPADSNRGFLKGLYKYKPAPEGDIKPPTESFLSKATDSSLWFAKSKDRFRLQLEGVLEEPLAALITLFDRPYKEYRSARLILGQLYNLGVVGELRRAFTDIQREKNILSIDDSNTLLRDIIDGSDAPFVYEKLGVRFEDFLLDEFQDTSAVQWKNFRPLLANSLSGGFDNLVVGDVKQSIYRWRGSDWRQLDSGVQAAFGLGEDSVDVLGENHRTLGGIVRFNNAFFRFSAETLDRMLGAGAASPGSISRIYRDVRQEVAFPDPAEGSVEVAFCPDAGMEIPEVLRSIREIRERGAGYGDIAILVRYNAEGSSIAARLIAEGIPVVSDDSLFVKSSVTVRRLVSQLSLVDTPPEEDDRSVRGFLARTMQVVPPENYLSLSDLAESILRDLQAADPETFGRETAYIHAFMDFLQDWTHLNGNRLSAFLKAWEEAKPKIASPDAGSSVRVITVHKAKGLEFPYVIFPFAEKVELFGRRASAWCRPERTSPSIDGLYHINLSGTTRDTLFADDYLRELELTYIDNLNIFYVALTRPVYGLKIIAETPSSGIAGAVEALRENPDAPVPKYGNMSEILYGWLGSQKDTAFLRMPPRPDEGPEGEEEVVLPVRFTKGALYDFSTLERKPSASEPLPLGYPSIPLNREETDPEAPEGERGRLKFSPEAADFFGPDGTVGKDASRRIRGQVMHRILSDVRAASDLPKAVGRALRRGDIVLSEQAETEARLAAAIAAAPAEWFPADGSRVLNEATILIPGEGDRRPDRVVRTEDGGAIVIDFKFGAADPRYRRQVRRYMQSFSAMGYAPVRGFLWYFRGDGPDFFEEISM
jgi:ATP-dependent exoDNAse (exonuclease V) beta subunit